MANRGLFRRLKDSSGVVLDSVAKTATFNSEKFNLKGLEYFGILVDINTVTGTSPTLDIKAQVSPDDGTTWLDTFPGAANSETQITLTQVTTSTTETMEYWVNPFPVNNNVKGRFVFTIAGTSPSYTADYWLIGKRFGRD